MLHPKLIKFWVNAFLDRKEGTFHKFLKLSDETQLEIVKQLDEIVNARYRKGVK